jgi:hypothetical protein
MIHKSHTVSPESLEALTSGDKDRGRVVVLEQIRHWHHYGAIADEVCVALGWGHNSVAPRFTELNDEGLIVKLIDANGKRVRRKTRQGCYAGVYVAAEFAPVHMQTGTISPTFPEFGDLNPKPEPRHRDDN